MSLSDEGDERRTRSASRRGPLCRGRDAPTLLGESAHNSGGRGAAYYSAADFERAVDDFSRAIKLGLVDRVVFYLRSLANSQLGDGVSLDPDLPQ
jgi:hypothetical protein